MYLGANIRCQPTCHLICKELAPTDPNIWFENSLIVFEIPLLPGEVNLAINNSFFLESPNIEGTFPKKEYETLEKKRNNNNTKTKTKLVAPGKVLWTHYDIQWA